VAENVIPIPGWPYRSTVLNYLFALKSGNSYDLARNAEAYRGRVPDDYLPIADDPAGNLFCVTLRGDDKGAIYFWDHEHEREDPSDRGNMYRVAGDIRELLSKLRAE